MLKNTLRTAAIVAGLAALTALGACSQAKPDATPTPTVTATPTRPVTAPTPTSNETSMGPLREADAQPGLRTLSKLGPTTGSQIVGRIHAKPASLFLTVICRGNGSLVVALEPLSRTSVPCGDGTEVNRTVDQLTSPQELKITVAATGAVERSLRVQQ